MQKFTEAELLEQIKNLQEELQKIKKQKKYGIVWEEKEENINRNFLPIIEELKELRIEESEQKPYNLIIEGDNFHALSVLQNTHKAKIDVIYIDPPYNTGNKDFIYNDDYVDKEDTYRHSKWLSFMRKRLELAKNLLKEDGVIFISIDDNEFAQLKLLCDEIFGEKNFVSNSIIINNRGGRDYGGIAKQHEYLLIYSKNESLNLNMLNEKDKKFQYTDEIGGFDLMELRNRNIKFNNLNRPNLCYPFFVNPNNKDTNGLFEISLEEKEGYIRVMPAISQGVQTVWRWGKEERSRKNLNKEIFGKENKNGGFMIVQKYRKTEKMQRSIWDEKEFVNERGSEAIKELLGHSIFSYPKSVFLLKRILEISSKPNSTILDFFAGSGTTGHAVLELNKEDGGNRQFILCSNTEATKENPEKNICKNITYERNKRVMQGYTNVKGEQIEGLGGNLRYYQTKFIKKEESIDDLRDSFINKCDDLLCIKENTFTKVKTPKDIAELKVFKNHNNFTVILYDILYFRDLIDLLKLMEDKKVNLYIFSQTKNIFEEELESFKNITFANIPDEILETYEKIFGL